MKNRWIRRQAKGQKLHRSFRKDNRGASIVLVIIAMAMIGILASTMLWMAYLNYMIKLTDLKTKNSFYSAETVMEQIMAGMQHEASAAVSLGYQDVMKNWENYEGEGGRFQAFADVYLDTLIAYLKDSSKGNGYYDPAVLEEFIDDSLLPGMNMVTDTSSPEYANSWYNSSRKMELVNNYTLILRDIKVSYTDGNGYVSMISTDICIDVPKLVFQYNSADDKLYEYSLIGNEGIETKAGVGASTIEGSIYAGINESTKTGGIVVNSGTSITIKNGRHVISKGDIAVEGPNAAFRVRAMSGNEESCVYAQNLKLNSGVLSLDSRTFVADDLVLFGSGSRATITREYYGYGSSTATGLIDGETVDSSASSAIIINGKNATVDFSGVTKLLLAGRAYIGQSLTDNLPESENPLPSGDPVLMGESIAVKGNQIAYLVPAECIGTVDGRTIMGINPLNGTNAAKMEELKIEYGDEFVEVDFHKPIYKLDNKTLSDYGVTDMKHIRKVYAQYNSSNDADKTLLYYYLVMDKDKAAEYFVQYYNFNSNKEALDAYFNKYASGGIILGDYGAENTEYTILGNSLVSSTLSESGVTLLTGLDNSLPEGGEGEEEAEEPGEENSTEYKETGENAETVVNEKDTVDALTMSYEYEGIYKALTTNLTEDASSVSPIQNVYNSVIRDLGSEGGDETNNLTKYLANHGGTVKFTSPEGYEAILTNADYTLPSSGYQNIKLIVSQGDVTLDKNFSGLVIAKGKITIANAVEIKRDKEGLYKALNATTGVEGDTTIPLQYIYGSGVEAGNEDVKVDEKGQLDVDFTEIVRYANWIKK
ncbi:MAG: hypothetical protein PUD93_03655 [Lachnospiraceae bacterium]|nr:hypothetical protein [Lachnospiraceae bacterium]